MKNIIGHDDHKKQLAVAIQSAQARNEAPPHLLFSGLAGCGKTTMAKEVAAILETDFISILPDDLSDSEEVMKTLEKLNHDGYDEYGNRISRIKPTIVFVDEIHRMPRKGQEIMGIAMEKFLLESGKPNSYYWIPYFTLIGATTDDGELTKPFREKFRLRFLFSAYSDEEIIEIINLHASRKGSFPTRKARREIAKRSRGVPRIATQYLDRVIDLAIHNKALVITSELVNETFSLLGIDSLGLNKVEISILETLYKASEPIGLENLAIVTNESSKNIHNTIEPFLIQKGLMIRTGRGRMITEAGRKHLEGDGHLKKILKKEIPLNYERT